MQAEIFCTIYNYILKFRFPIVNISFLKTLWNYKLQYNYDIKKKYAHNYILFNKKSHILLLYK